VEKQKLRMIKNENTQMGVRDEQGCGLRTKKLGGGENVHIDLQKTGEVLETVRL